MTTPIVPSISDEQLADSERLIADLEQFVCIGSIAALIARLRAAEADAKRYRWLRDQHNELSGDCWVSVYSRDTCEWQSIDSNVLGIDREDDLDLDAAIDAAMERTP